MPPQIKVQVHQLGQVQELLLLKILLAHLQVLLLPHHHPLQVVNQEFHLVEQDLVEVQLQVHKMLLDTVQVLRLHMEQELILQVDLVQLQVPQHKHSILLQVVQVLELVQLHLQQLMDKL